MATKQTQNRVKRTVNKAARRNPKAFIIAAVAVVLIVAISLAVLYFAFPETWDTMIELISGDNASPNGQNQDEENTATPPALTQGEGELQVHFINVGQGDCILILFPDGKDMLIDWGNKSSDYEQTVTEAYLSSLISDNQLDYLMLTHGDEDHVEYVDDVLNDYQVDNLYMPNIKAESDKFAAQIAALPSEKLNLFTDEDTLSSDMYSKFFIAALSEPNCNLVINQDTDDSTNNIVIEDADKTYNLTFFCPTAQYYESSSLNNAERKNAVSPIGILEYNGKRIVLTGDSNEINEPIFVDRATAKYGSLDCDVLKVGHHGSATSTTNEFLDYLNCEYAVISCKQQGNTFYHPRQVTLDRIIAHNMSIYRTDLQGNIICSIDGEGVLSFTTELTATEAQLKDGLTDADIEALKAA